MILVFSFTLHVLPFTRDTTNFCVLFSIFINWLFVSFEMRYWLFARKYNTWLVDGPLKIGGNEWAKKKLVFLWDWICLAWAYMVEIVSKLISRVRLELGYILDSSMRYPWQVVYILIYRATTIALQWSFLRNFLSLIFYFQTFHTNSVNSLFNRFN